MYAGTAEPPTIELTVREKSIAPMPAVAMKESMFALISDCARARRIAA